MNKIISYSIFGARETKREDLFLFRAYLRGVCWNVRMNALIFPRFRSHIEVDSGTFSDFDHIFRGLNRFYGASFGINEVQPLCKAMLWRMKPVFFPDSDYVFCRDAESITTYKEAQAVNEFIESGLVVHGMTDNIVHTTPLMGGMVGFKAHEIRERYRDWDSFLSLSRSPISERGTDQKFLVDVIYPEFKNKMFAHYFGGMRNNGEAIVKTATLELSLPGVSPALWESNLTCRHIGSAGVVDLETIRFFKRFEKENQMEEIEKKYPQIFYWQAL